MQINQLLEYDKREQLREWLLSNHTTCKEVWVAAYRGETSLVANLPSLPYLDVVEEALCFGWIDSTNKKLPDGRLAQRISPRQRNSHWTELNKQRCLSLIDKGLMTKSGLAVFPK